MGQFGIDIWMTTIAIAYRNNEISRDAIIDSMIPFYHSRILSFVNKTGDMGIKDCEEYFEHIVRVFEEEKEYLIKRWDEDHKKKLNHMTMSEHVMNLKKWHVSFWQFSM